ncbi:sugar transferase [Mesorhizobium sp. CAU 1741]|uniref:sugar transferase n=1 Tax=Mesorhizobium sp. CAU 1741 TaxID=3140366 RepID=UPI00325B4073
MSYLSDIHGAGSFTPLACPSEPPQHRHQVEEVDQSGIALWFSGGGPISPRMTRWRNWRLAIKRIADIVISLAVLLLALPFLVAIGLAIRGTSAGGAIFRQRREGLGGHPIEILKFRSVYSEHCDEAGLCQMSRNDPRVTPLGRFLRRTSLDELPQLVNVLKGEMSLVGPRPHPAGLMAAGQRYQDLVPFYEARLAMKPGITGWAQAHGLRGPTCDPEMARRRVEHDIAYIQNFTLALDARIVARTFVNEFLRGSGG